MSRGQEILLLNRFETSDLARKFQYFLSYFWKGNMSYDKARKKRDVIRICKIEIVDADGNSFDPIVYKYFVARLNGDVIEALSPLFDSFSDAAKWAQGEGYTVDYSSSTP